MHLHLNSHWDATENKCMPNALPPDSGANGVDGCYDSEELDPQGNRLTTNTTCAPCQIGVDAGCFFAPPPDRPNIELLPPFNPFPDIQHEPGRTPGINPGEIMPDEPPPMMDFYIPWRWQ